jgi:AcrR family transcriptional regulator
MPATSRVIPLPRTRPQARGIVTRRRVLQAAEQLFATRGYEPASMAMVARRANIGVGTVYHHFPDKRALLLALIDDWGDRELASRQSALDFERFRGPDVRAAIASILRSRYEEIRSSGGFRLVIIELAERDSEVRARIARIEQVVRERMRDLIAYSQLQGTMRRDLDPLAAALLVQNAIRAAATEVFVHQVSEPAPERVLEELIQMICRYLLEDNQ